MRPDPTSRRLAAVVLVLTALLGVAAWAHLSFGAEGISLVAAWAGPGVDRDILLGLRLPRLIVAGIVGGGLAAAGAAFQVLLRNPLADPFILGVSGGAALGGTLALLFTAGLGAALVGMTLLPAASFAGALAAMALTGWLGRRAPGRDGATVTLLTGVVLNTFASAVILFLKSLADPRQAQEILLWLMGSLAVEGLDRAVLAVAGGLILVGMLLLHRRAPELNLLALGPEEALQLGVDAPRVARQLSLAASLVVGAAVSVTGLVGFVGLVVPHLLRLLIGPDVRLLLPASALLGAVFLTLADLLSRVLFPALGSEAPVGAVTAFLGGPLFLWLLYRRHRQEEQG
ncbi:MAG: iron ABC transporter permease [Myxococcota bacterium]|jgi:iron complex transport system permease protein|nr:iron ABC transporter permease [Myxococcota bacterium]